MFVVFCASSLDSAGALWSTSSRGRKSNIISISSYYTYIYIYIVIYVYMYYTCIHIYIYIDREREREIYIYIYIYICIHRALLLLVPPRRGRKQHFHNISLDNYINKHINT